jgi:hypothetical protein
VSCFGVLPHHLDWGDIVKRFRWGSSLLAEIRNLYVLIMQHVLSENDDLRQTED